MSDADLVQNMRPLRVTHRVSAYGWPRHREKRKRARHAAVQRRNRPEPKEQP